MMTAVMYVAITPPAGKVL